MHLILDAWDSGNNTICVASKVQKFSNAFSLFSHNIPEDNLYNLLWFSVAIQSRFPSTFAAYLYKLLKLVLPIQLLHNY